MSRLANKFINIDPNTLNATVDAIAAQGLAVRTKLPGGIGDLSPFYGQVYYGFMYPAVYERECAQSKKKASSGRSTAYALAPPEPWLVALAGVMWEGIIQGLAWDVVKVAVRNAATVLRDAGLFPKPQHGGEKTTTLRIGWSSYADSEEKQFEMFLSLKRSVEILPEGHAVAVARARDTEQFGKLIRAAKREKGESKPSGLNRVRKTKH